MLYPGKYSDVFETSLECIHRRTNTVVTTSNFWSRKRERTAPSRNIPNVLSLGSSGSGVLLSKLCMSPRRRCLCLLRYWNSAYSCINQKLQNTGQHAVIFFWCNEHHIFIKNVWFYRFIIKSPVLRKINCKLHHAMLKRNNKKKIQGNPKSIK